MGGARGAACLVAAASLVGLAWQIRPVAAGETETGGWEKLYVKDGITGYRRTTPDSNYAAWKGHGIVASPFFRVVAVYMDSDRSCEWLADCVENRFIEKPDLEHQTSYNRTHLPWPFQDRDLVFTDHFAFDSKTRRVVDVMRSVEHPKAPERKGIVRAILLESTFEARAIDDEHTFVEVSLHLDTRGFLPAWLVNMTSKNWPLETFTRLRKAAAGTKGFEALEAQLRAQHPFEE